MREYKIVRNDRGWNISRKKQMGRLILLQYLNGKGLRGSNIGFAKTFYQREDAERALAAIKKNEGEKSD